MCEAKVSIPYSSGQCFFYKVMLFYFEQTPWGSFNPLFIRSVFLLERSFSKFATTAETFQSLIHQVSVSFTESKMK